jgi:hypothetical protein
MTLELTSEEAEMIKSALELDRTLCVAPAVSATLQRKIDSLDAILSKINLASQVQEPVVITHKNLLHVISMAKTEYQALHGDLHISNEKVLSAHFVHISLANALISWFNSKNMLKRLARFDYTDNSYQYETTED